MANRNLFLRKSHLLKVFDSHLLRIQRRSINSFFLDLDTTLLPLWWPVDFGIEYKTVPKSINPLTQGLGTP